MNFAYRIVLEIVIRPLEEHWLREVEIPENYSLHEVHLCIQNLIGFEDDHMYDFYGSIDGWKQSLKFSEEECFDLMIEGFDSIKLKDVFPLKRRRMNLYYLFDYGDSWRFVFRQPRRIRMVSDVKYPTIIQAIGPNPKQYIFES